MDNQSLSKKILHLLFEANVEQYKDMGNFLKKDYDIKNSYDIFIRNFDTAKNLLPKPSFISWITKCILIRILCKLLWRDDCRLELTDKQIDIIIGKINKYLKDFGENDLRLGDTGSEEFEKELYKIMINFPHTDILERMKNHYLAYKDDNGNSLDDIVKYDFTGKSPDKVFEDLDGIINKFEAKHYRAFFIDEKEEKEIYGDEFEIVITFDDGWHWVHKKVNDCRLEAKYGGHCGRAETEDETILSLREPTEIKNKYKIWCTFSIDKEGYLKQRKGTVEIFDDNGKLKKREGNNKPLPFTYKYIYELLKQDWIVGFYKESDYKPELDFYLEDFPKNTIEKLIDDRDGEEFLLKSREEEKDLLDRFFDGELDCGPDTVSEVSDYLRNTEGRAYVPDIFIDGGRFIRPDLVKVCSYGEGCLYDLYKLSEIATGYSILSTKPIGDSINIFLGAFRSEYNIDKLNDLALQTLVYLPNHYVNFGSDLFSKMLEVYSNEFIHGYKDHLGKYYGDIGTILYKHIGDFIRFVYKKYTEYLTGFAEYFFDGEEIIYEYDKDVFIREYQFTHYVTCVLSGFYRGGGNFTFGSLMEKYRENYFDIGNSGVLFVLASCIDGYASQYDFKVRIEKKLEEFLEDTLLNSDIDEFRKEIYGK